MCKTHKNGLLALGIIHITCGLLICVSQGTLTTYLEVRDSIIGRFMNISPGLWLGFSLCITGFVTTALARKRIESQTLSAVAVALSVISLGLAIVVIVFDQRFLMEFKKWLWRKQRFTTDPNPLIDADFNMYHQLLRNRLDIEALFILGACMLGLTVMSIIFLMISISLTARFLCDCCSEYGFVRALKHPTRTTMIMVPSRENLRHSMPLLTTEL